MIRLLTDIASYLGGEQVGSIGHTLFLGNLPASPAALTAVIPAEAPFLPGEVLIQQGFRVVVRGEPHQYPATLARVETIFNVLRDKWNVLPNVIGRILPQHRFGEPFRDENGNLVWSMAFMLTTYTSTL